MRMDLRNTKPYVKPVSPPVRGMDGFYGVALTLPNDDEHPWRNPVTTYPDYLPELCIEYTIKPLNVSRQVSLYVPGQTINWRRSAKLSGPWFNTKMPSCQNRKSLCGDNAVIRSSYLHNGISYSGKMVSFYWTNPLISVASTMETQ